MGFQRVEKPAGRPGRPNLATGGERGVIWLEPVTAVIVLLSSDAATLGPLGYALDRVLEITLGSVVGVAVSVPIAPPGPMCTFARRQLKTALLLAQIMTALEPAVRTGAPDLGK